VAFAAQPEPGASGGPEPAPGAAGSGSRGGPTHSPVPQEEGKSTTENLRIIGGLIALGIGLVVLLAIVVVAIFQLPASEAGAAATGGITALGSMVGAYFGVKVGSDGTKEAIKGQKEEATRAQAFALGVDPAASSKVLEALAEMTGGEPPAAPK